MARETKDTLVLEVVKPAEIIKEPIKDMTKISTVKMAEDAQFYHGDRWHVFKKGNLYKVSQTIKEKLAESRILEVI